MNARTRAQTAATYRLYVVVSPDTASNAKVGYGLQDQVNSDFSSCMFLHPSGGMNDVFTYTHLRWGARVIGGGKRQPDGQPAHSQPVFCMFILRVGGGAHLQATVTYTG